MGWEVPVIKAGLYIKNPVQRDKKAMNGERDGFTKRRSFTEGLLWEQQVEVDGRGETYRPDWW